MSKWWRTAAGNLRWATETSSRSYHTIQAIPREITGHRVSIKDRAQGRIPAVVFAQPNPSDGHGGGGSTTAWQVSKKHLITTERRQIQSILNSIDVPYFCSTIFPLQIRAGSGSEILLESGNVLPVKVHRDPNTGKVLNLVFLWADKGEVVKVNVPVVFKGEDVCPGLKKGGYLNKIRTSLKFLCPSEHIPQKIEVDISNLDIGDKVTMKHIEVHPAMKFLGKDEKMPVCKIVATKSESSETGELSTESENS